MKHYKIINNRCMCDTIVSLNLMLLHGRLDFLYILQITKQHFWDTSHNSYNCYKQCVIKRKITERLSCTRARKPEWYYITEPVDARKKILKDEIFHIILFIKDLKRRILSNYIGEIWQNCDFLFQSTTYIFEFVIKAWNKQ